jgi:hypothetical protein
MVICAILREQHLQTFGQQIQITGSHASQPALERNFSRLTEEYGSVHGVNLLGIKNEAILTGAYAVSQEGYDMMI